MKVNHSDKGRDCRRWQRPHASRKKITESTLFLPQSQNGNEEIFLAIRSILDYCYFFINI
jgi:hypothetical protein